MSGLSNERRKEIERRAKGEEFVTGPHKNKIHREDLRECLEEIDRLKDCIRDKWDEGKEKLRQALNEKEEENRKLRELTERLLRKGHNLPIELVREGWAFLDGEES